MTEQHLMRAIVARLNEHGLNAVIEYPGYIHVIMDDKYTAWQIGTANGPWGGDLVAGDGDQLGEVLSSFELPTESAQWTDAEQIAMALIAAINRR